MCSSRNRVQYYQRMDPKDFNGIYIKEKDAWLARGLAQKDYDQKILKVIENELGYIEKYLSSDSVQSAEQVYERLHKERQKLICRRCSGILYQPRRKSTFKIRMDHRGFAG